MPIESSAAPGRAPRRRHRPNAQFALPAEFTGRRKRIALEAVNANRVKRIDRGGNCLRLDRGNGHAQIVFLYQTRHLGQLGRTKREACHHILEELVGQGELVVTRVSRQSKKTDIERRRLADQRRHWHRRRQLNPVLQAEAGNAFA